MGMERQIALLIVVLVITLGVRFLIREGAVPAIQPVTSPFFAVYFASSQEVLLVPELYPGEPTMADAAAYLLRGPSGSHLLPVLPEGTIIYDYSLVDTVCYVNFSQHLVADHPGGSASELITVYGIVNTFAAASGAEAVQILVEGQPIETIAGHVYTGKPLTPDYSLAGAWLI